MASENAERDRRRLRILIVEDELLIADYLSLIMEDAGHQIVAIATNGPAALDRLEQDPAVDLVTLDLKIAGSMSGLEVAARIRHTYGKPFVFFTGSVEPKVRSQCELLEPLVILQKPIDPGTLVQFLESYSRRG